MMCLMPTGIYCILINPRCSECCYYMSDYNRNRPWKRFVNGIPSLHALQGYMTFGISEKRYGVRVDSSLTSLSKVQHKLPNFCKIAHFEKSDIRIVKWTQKTGTEVILKEMISLPIRSLRKPCILQYPAPFYVDMESTTALNSKFFLISHSAKYIQNMSPSCICLSFNRYAMQCRSVSFQIFRIR